MSSVFIENGLCRLSAPPYFIDWQTIVDDPVYKALCSMLTESNFFFVVFCGASKTGYVPVQNSIWNLPELSN